MRKILHSPPFFFFKYKILKNIYQKYCDRFESYCSFYLKNQKFHRPKTYISWCLFILCTPLYKLSRLTVPPEGHFLKGLVLRM